MKTKKLFSILLASLLVAQLCACSETKTEPIATQEKTETPVTEKRWDCESAYDNVLSDTNRLLKSYAYLPEPKEGEQGLWEIAGMYGEDALEAVGYAFRDLNGDGREELLIGRFANREEEKAKNDLCAVYTHDGNAPRLVLEGRSRSSYALLTDNGLCFYGSGGAMYSMFGIYDLAKDGTLACRDFYFTYEADETMQEIAFYHNTTGEWDPAVSERLDIPEEAFWNIEKNNAANTAHVIATSFYTYDQRSFYKNNETVPPTAEEAVALLRSESSEAAKMLDDGYLPREDEEFVTVHGDTLRRVTLYREASETEGEEATFAVGSSKAIYLSESDNGEEAWLPLNAAAAVFAEAPEQALLYIDTDEASDKRAYYLPKATEISTPIVGQANPTPMVVVALKDNIKITVEMEVDDSTTDVFFNSIVNKGEAFAINAIISEQDSALRIVVTNYEETEKQTVQWYANAKNGSRSFSEYVSVE